MSANSAPGFKNHPEHRVETKPADARVRVMFNGEVIANSRDAIRLDESKYAPVYYLPRKDVKMERLTRTTHSTHCCQPGLVRRIPRSTTVTSRRG